VTNTLDYNNKELISVIIFIVQPPGPMRVNSNLCISFLDKDFNFKSGRFVAKNKLRIAEATRACPELKNLLDICPGC